MKLYIIQIVYLVAMLLLGGLAAYLKQRAVLLEAAKGAIDHAEAMYADATKAGGKKFAWCVDTLYNMVPAPLRIIITREVIEGIIQRTFDAMQSYAAKQLDKVADKILHKDDALIDDGK